MINNDVNAAALSKVSKYNHLIEVLNSLDEEEMSIMIMVINAIQMEKTIQCGRLD